MQVNQAQLIVTGDLAPDWITKWSDTVKPIMIRLDKCERSTIGYFTTSYCLGIWREILSQLQYLEKKKAKENKSKQRNCGFQPFDDNNTQIKENTPN